MTKNNQSKNSKNRFPGINKGAIFKNKNLRNQQTHNLRLKKWQKNKLNQKYEIVAIFESFYQNKIQKGQFGVNELIKEFIELCVTTHFELLSNSNKDAKTDPNQFSQIQMIQNYNISEEMLDELSSTITNMNIVVEILKICTRLSKTENNRQRETLPTESLESAENPQITILEPAQNGQDFWTKEVILYYDDYHHRDSVKTKFQISIKNVQNLRNMEKKNQDIEKFEHKFDDPKAQQQELFDEEIFAQLNSMETINQYIDLHGQSRQKAIQYTSEKIQEVDQNLQNSVFEPNYGDGKNHVFKILTGAGIHSGRKGPVLKPAIESFLANQFKDAQQYYINKHDGVFLIRFIKNENN